MNLNSILIGSEDPLRLTAYYTSLFGEPGWRWSNDVKPIAGTDWCMVLHEGYCVSGSAIVRAEDGTETSVGPGDGYVIQPGHDAWVVGDEPWVTVDFSQSMADYAKPGGAA